MEYDLIADHIRQQREADIDHARLERLVRRDAPPTTIDRLRLTVARTLISIAHAVGGEQLRATRSARLPARPAS